MTTHQRKSARRRRRARKDVPLYQRESVAPLKYSDPRGHRPSGDTPADLMLGYGVTVVLESNDKTWRDAVRRLDVRCGRIEMIGAQRLSDSAGELDLLWARTRQLTEEVAIAESRINALLHDIEDLQERARPWWRRAWSAVLETTVHRLAKQVQTAAALAEAHEMVTTWSHPSGGSITATTVMPVTRRAQRPR